MIQALIASSNSWLARLVRRFAAGRPSLPALRQSHEHFARLDQDKPLEDYEFTVLDTELTGMNASRDEIVEIGAVKIRGMRVETGDFFHTLVHPRGEMPRESTLIHRITPDEVREAPRLRDILPGFVSYLGDSLVIGHHVGLDMAFLNRACRDVFGAILLNPCLDTLVLARAYHEQSWTNHLDRYDYTVSYNLTDLSRKYGIPLFESHNALQDAIQTAYLFLFLARKLGGGAVKTLKDLHQAGRRNNWY